MHISDLRTAVKTLTGRYDLTNDQINDLIRQVVFQIAVSGKWVENYMEETIDFPQLDTTQSVEWFGSEGLGGATALELVVAISPGGLHHELTQALPRDLYKLGRHCDTGGTYYRVGNTLQLRGVQPFNQVYVGAYRGAPENLETSSNYWMFGSIPEIIIAGTAAQIYRLLGESDTFSMYEMEFQRLLATFKAARSDGEVR